MADADRHRLRATFDEVADLYEAARPTYPPQLFDDLVSLAGLSPGARVVEIGCGTGQATLPLAERGLEIVCVELGERLAQIARRKLAAFPNVEVVVGSFETWEPLVAEFDAIVSFNAFHWLDPDVRYAKAARLVRKGGALVIGGVVHVLPEGGDPFWSEVQADYDAVVPSPDNEPPPPPEDVDDLSEQIEAGGLFRHVATGRYPLDVPYTADEYLAVLGTYSANLALDGETRGQLYERIRCRIEARPEPTVTKHYLVMLNVARKL